MFNHLCIKVGRLDTSERSQIINYIVNVIGLIMDTDTNEDMLIYIVKCLS